MPLSDKPSAAAPAQPSLSGAERQPAHAHLLDRLAVLHRHRYLAFAIFALTALAVVVRDYTALQFFRATARVLIEDERSIAIPGLATTESAFYQDPEPYYQTQYKILKGRDLARQVARELKLDQVPEFNAGGRVASAAAPLAQTTATADITSLASTEPAARPGAAASVVADDEWATYVDGFLGRVSVDPVRGSRLVDVSFTSVNPQFAAAAVNALVQAYVRQNLAVKQETTASTLAWLAKELADQQGKVETSERALAEYRDHQNALSLDDKQNIVVARLNQLNDAATKAKTARIQKESLYRQLAALPAGSSADTLLVIAQNPQIQGLKAKLAELQHRFPGVDHDQLVGSRGGWRPRTGQRLHDRHAPASEGDLAGRAHLSNHEDVLAAIFVDLDSHLRRADVAACQALAKPFLELPERRPGRLNSAEQRECDAPRLIDPILTSHAVFAEDLDVQLVLWPDDVR